MLYNSINLLSASALTAQRRWKGNQVRVLSDPVTVFGEQCFNHPLYFDTRRRSKAMNHESGNLLNSSKVENFRAKFGTRILWETVDDSAFMKKVDFFMECRKVRTWTYRIMRWLNGRWGVLLLLSCFTKFCFPATDETAHPPQEQNNSWLKSGHFIRKQYFIFFIGLCIEWYAVFLRDRNSVITFLLLYDKPCFCIMKKMIKSREQNDWEGNGWL